MRYYVVADVHGFYTELIAALTDKRFFVPRKQKNWEVKNIEITSIIIDKSIIFVYNSKH